MIVRRNLPLSKMTQRSTADDLLALRETPSRYEQQTTLLPYPSHTLNPENPITSVLVSSKESHPVVGTEKQDSEFSFKQRGLLSEEDPQLLEQVADAPQQKAQIVEKKQPPFTIAVQKDTADEGRVPRGKKCIGMITHPRQRSNKSRPQASQNAQPIAHKPANSSLGSSRLEEVLNKIKSLRIGGTEDHPPQSHHYSTVRYSQQKMESTDASGQESSPIKKSVISSIRKHVERMNLSLAKDHKIRQEDSDSEEHSLVFRATEGSSRMAAEELLQSKNKSFLVRSTNKKTRRDAETVHISYRTTLLELKELCTRHDESMKIKVAVPASFARPFFDTADAQEDMFGKAVAVLRELGVASLHPMTIRKYSNCVLVLVDDLALLSHFTGQAYFGGWQEGRGKGGRQEGKNGLGLEWTPGRFVYYGEFSGNKREGYGVLKEWEGATVLGEWRGGRPLEREHKGRIL